MELRATRGMHDLWGETLAQWSAIERKVKSVLESFGYREIRTPAVERIEVFSHTVGEETDIVEKQMYTLMGDVSEKLVLRPEGTASFVRAVVEHQLNASGRAERFYYYIPMFRHERPQKGRLRQFHQFGAEVINDPSPEVDAEIVALLDHLFGSLGVKEYAVRVNSIGCSECRPPFTEYLKTYLQSHAAVLCEECRARLDRSPLRILDCKKEGCRAVAEKSPRILHSLCVACRNHHEGFKKRLALLSVPFEEDPFIVRGLDYYCRTAFEFLSNLLGSQSALVGGGRYDGISERFGGVPFPAVGFGLGMERLMMVLEQKKLLPVVDRSPIYYFAALGEEAFVVLYRVAFELKKRGVGIEMSYDGEKRLKSHLKQADRLGSHFTLICGEEELKRNTAILKDMRQGTQIEIPIQNLDEELLRRAGIAT